VGELMVKRALDMLVAAGALLLLLPLWGLVAAALWLWQGRPIFYRQSRIGRGGAPFTLYKFRTMRDGAPPRLPDRPIAKAAHDPRVTPFGRLLRRTAFDETPQFLNVLRGDMSLVGPRPLPQADLAQHGWLHGVTPAERARREAWAARRQEVRPGLTGLWQISPNAVDDFDNWIARDLAYLEQRSLLLDLRIILCTPWALLRGRRAQEERAR
jgi:lipopolysaccharide/colanic/teichoic acid biosynthesis glycosyltransferase